MLVIYATEVTVLNVRMSHNITPKLNGKLPYVLLEDPIKSCNYLFFSSDN